MRTKILMIAFLISVMLIGCAPTPTPAPTGSVEGAVMWATNGGENVPVVGIPVTLWEGSNIVAQGMSDVSGKYDIVDIPAGTYLISAFQADNESTSAKCWSIEITVNPDKTSRVYLSFDNALYEEDFAQYPLQCVPVPILNTNNS